MKPTYGGSEWQSPEGVMAVKVASTAYYGVQLPEQGVDQHTTLLVALHGWGQSGRSFLRRFRSLQSSNVLVVAPQGPHQLYLDMETRKVGFSWLTAYDRKRAVSDIVALLDTVLEAVEGTYGVKSAPVLLGFSQGVSMAYRYSLLGSRNVLGVIACGGDLPPDVATALPDAPRFPVLLVHGREDTIVPFSKYEAAREKLTALGVVVETCLFDGGHDVPRPAVEEIHGWIERHKDVSLL